MRPLQAGKFFFSYNIHMNDFLFTQVGDGVHLLLCHWRLGFDSFFSIIRRESFCKILNISSSSYKVMKSSMMCGFCMKKSASTVKLMCLISIIYLTLIQFLVKINAILICNLKFSFHLTSRRTLYIVHG